jgi:F0F1-type ATP synthase assembly protein I
MKKVILTYGLISGLIVMIFMIASTLLWYKKPDLGFSEIVGFTGMFIAFIFVFVGIKNYRDKHNSGNINFLTAFKIGTLIALIAACIYTLVWMVEFHFFIPDFMEKYAASSIEKIKSSGLSAAIIKEKITEMEEMRESYKNPLFMIFFTLMEIFPIGLFVALISALILKRKPALN